MESVEVSVGNGNDTSFWHDMWLRGMLLKEVFPRLFMLSIDKVSLIEVIGRV